MRTVLIGFAISQLALGLLLWLAPGFFFDEVGPYGTRNDHYMGDLAGWYLALGALTLASVGRPGWRVPLLGLALVQNALHSVNHLIDVGEADPSHLGPVNLVLLLLATLLLAWMLKQQEEVVGP